jgi:hypothetical protein
MSVGHHRIQVPMFGSILHRCNLARGQMVHFVSNLSNFIMFAVRWAGGPRPIDP